MATRDLIPTAFDDDDFEPYTDGIDVTVLPERLAQHGEEFVFFPDPEHEVSAGDTATAPQPVAVLPAAPAPTIGSAFSQLVSLIAEQLRGARQRVDRKTAAKLIGQGISVVGMLLLVLALFESTIGGITEHRDQRELRGAFNEMLEAGGGFAAVTKSGTRIIPNGTPVAELEIPAIGVRRIVAEGTTSDDLRKGPGHMRSTPLPGQHGNAVIAGRRTTYGGAFRNLDALEKGDEINVTTPFGRFRYEVREVVSLASGAPDRLGATMSDDLTLTTSDPPYRATKRLVVIARLDGMPSAFPDPLRQTKVGMEEGSFFGDASKAIPALFWELGVFFALIGARALYGRWRRWPAYLVSSPIVAMMVFGWVQTMTGLLPSTL